MTFEKSHLFKSKIFITYYCTTYTFVILHYIDTFLNDMTIQLEIHIPPTFYGNVFHFILLMPHLKLTLNLFYLVFVSQIKG